MDSPRTTVWKFPLPLMDVAGVEMPGGAEVIYVGAQGEGAYIWALVNPDAPRKTRTFRVAGTGHTIGVKVGAHVGSFMLLGGALVFHVFEIPR